MRIIAFVIILVSLILAPALATLARDDRIIESDTEIKISLDVLQAAIRKQGPWLAGMTLQSDVVSEAWCHERGYVCLIEEFGGRPIKAGESFSAAFVVGFFDSIDEMHAVYDLYAGHTGLEANPDGWKLTK